MRSGIRMCHVRATESFNQCYVRLQCHGGQWRHKGDTTGETLIISALSIILNRKCSWNGLLQSWTDELEAGGTSNPGPLGRMQKCESVRTKLEGRLLRA